MIPYADGLVPMRQEKQEVAGTLEVRQMCSRESEMALGRFKNLPLRGEQGSETEVLRHPLPAERHSIVLYVR